MCTTFHPICPTYMFCFASHAEIISSNLVNRFKILLRIETKKPSGRRRMYIKCATH